MTDGHIVNGYAIVRTCCSHIKSSRMFCTKKFKENHPKDYLYKDAFICDSFKIYDSVSGVIKVETHSNTPYSNVEVTMMYSIPHAVSIESNVELE